MASNRLANYHYKSHGLDGLFANPEKPGKDDEFIRMSAPTLSFSHLQKQLLNTPALQVLTASQQQQLEQFMSRIQSYAGHNMLLIGPDLQLPSLKAQQ